MLIPGLGLVVPGLGLGLGLPQIWEDYPGLGLPSPSDTPGLPRTRDYPVLGTTQDYPGLGTTSILFGRD